MSTLARRRSARPITYSIGVMLVLCAGVCWSFIPLGVKHFEHANAWHILVYRSIGVLPLVVWLIHREAQQGIRQAIHASGITGVVGALGLVAAYAGGVGAVLLTTIANAAFLFASAPFFAAILGRVLLKESLRPFTVIAICMATIGIVLMVYGGISRGHWLGNLLALISALGFAIFTVALRASRTTNSLPVVFLGALITLGLAALAIIVQGQTFVIPTREIALAFALGACLLGVGMVLYTYGSKVVPAAELALLCMTEVIFAPVWAWWFIGEYPAPSVLIGGAVVVVAIVVNALTGIRNKPRPFPL